MGNFKNLKSIYENIKENPSLIENFAEDIFQSAFSRPNLPNEPVSPSLRKEEKQQVNYSPYVEKNRNDELSSEYMKSNEFFRLF